MSSNQGRQIRKLPDDVYSADEHFYRPRKIFTGPYFSDSQRRGACVDCIRSRPSEQFEEYKQALRSMVEELKGSYHQLEDHWKRDEPFLGMMVVDGWCLLLIMTATVYGPGGDNDVLGYNNDDRQRFFNPNDIKAYKCDMLIYNNQIPLKVLERIISIQKPSWNESVIYEFLVKLILKFYSTREFFSSVPLSEYFELGSKSSHILDVYRNVLLMGSKSHDPRSPNRSGGEGESLNYNVIIPSATKLKGALINIRTTKSPCPMDISFSEKILRLPQLSLHIDATDLVFHNLIWFERFNPSMGMHISSYLYVMSNLIQDHTDSSLLKDRGVISTMMSDDKVAEVFKGMCKNMEFNLDQPMDHDLFMVGLDVRERYNKNSEEWRKDLFQNYLRSPWAYIPIGYAILILVLSVLQTVYTMRGFYNGK